MCYSSCNNLAAVQVHMSEDRACVLLDNFRGRGLVHCLYYVVKKLRAVTTSFCLFSRVFISV